MSKFKVGDEVSITSLVQFGDEPNEFNVCLGDTGKIVGFWSQSKYFAIVENKKFKASRAGEGRVYVPIAHMDLLSGYEKSNRIKLREHIKSLGFSAIDLSVAAGFNKAYFGSQSSESRFNSRGDISDDRLLELKHKALEAKKKLSDKLWSRIHNDFSCSGNVKAPKDEVVIVINNHQLPIYAIKPNSTKTKELIKKSLDKRNTKLEKPKSKWIVSNKVLFTFVFFFVLLISLAVTGIVKQVF